MTQPTVFQAVAVFITAFTMLIASKPGRTLSLQVLRSVGWHGNRVG